ncbi:DUF6081 family protein [Micromonospora sp. IBSANI012]|uniref:DUF6081 family protein n=1 Tax=Micromonospora sp. IBSANI012 TaxID=3457761 RepID=UPI0040582F9D
MTTVSNAGVQTVGEEPYRIVWDDFRDGFQCTGPDARWSLYGFGPHVGDDAEVTTSADGLRAVSSGVHPTTGEPAFVRTLGQEAQHGPVVPGALDHVKWLAYPQHLAGTGVQGFDAVPGRVLSFETWLSGRTYGTSGHPFGDQVTDFEDDLRLASVAMPVLDHETAMVFDFFLTNKRVYVFYERLPHARGQLGDYAAFLHTVPVADRTVDDEHHAVISYDRAAGTVRWFLDGEEVFSVDRIGHPLPSREHLMLDHGGEPTTVAPRQLAGGMGMFTILDGALPGRSARGLVRLTTADAHYVDPVAGAPRPQAFVDGSSLPGNRLFGQGAELRLRRYVISSQPSRP